MRRTISALVLAAQAASAGAQLATVSDDLPEQSAMRWLSEPFAVAAGPEFIPQVLAGCMPERCDSWPDAIEREWAAMTLVNRHADRVRRQALVKAADGAALRDPAPFLEARGDMVRLKWALARLRKVIERAEDAIKAEGLPGGRFLYADPRFRARQLDWIREMESDAEAVVDRIRAVALRLQIQRIEELTAEGKG